MAVASTAGKNYDEQQRKLERPAEQGSQAAVVQAAGSEHPLDLYLVHTESSRS